MMMGMKINIEYGYFYAVHLIHRMKYCKASIKHQGTYLIFDWLNNSR